MIDSIIKTEIFPKEDSFKVEKRSHMEVSMDKVRDLDTRYSTNVYHGEWYLLFGHG